MTMMANPIGEDTSTARSFTAFTWEDSVPSSTLTSTIPSAMGVLAKMLR